MKKIWFNHWFSTAYHIINLLKDDDKINFTVIGSSTDENCVYKKVCDEWALEPYIEDANQYVDYCLDFCKKNNINIFVPRRNMIAISKRLKDFEAINVLVLVEKDFGLINNFSDKAKTYELFDNAYIPKYFVIKNDTEFEMAYDKLKKSYERLCIKYTVDEGATSFRIIDDVTYNLKDNVSRKINYQTALNIIKNDTKPIIVMPYLAGDEVSVDCLYMNNKKHIIIPRYKSSTRSQTIKFDKEIVQVCFDFLNKFKLNCPFNIQFKYHEDVPYLLEINTRMSGGIQLSCMALGVNIPNIAVNKLLGYEKEVVYNKNNIVVSFIETPVILE